MSKLEKETTNESIDHGIEKTNDDDNDVPIDERYQKILSPGLPDKTHLAKPVPQARPKNPIKKPQPVEEQPSMFRRFINYLFGEIEVKEEPKTPEKAPVLTRRKTSPKKAFNTVSVTDSPNGTHEPPPPSRPKAASINMTAMSLAPKSVHSVNWTNNTRAVYQRPIDQLPLGTDIPRLTKFATLIDCRDGSPTIVFRGDANRTPENLMKKPEEKRPVQQQMKDFLLALADLLEPEKKQEIEDTFYQFVVPDVDMAVQKSSLKEFILKCFGEDDLITRILKCINQSIIAPAVIFLRMDISTKIQFKDASERVWEVVIRVNNDSIEISHLRRQTSLQKPGFAFVWKLVLTLPRKTSSDENSESETLQVHLCIPELTLDKPVQLKVREEVINVLSTFFTLDDLPSSLEVDFEEDLLNTDTMNKLPENI